MVAAALAAAACGGKEAARSDTAVTTAQSSASPGTPTPECPRTGHWSACHIRKRLEQSGLAPRDTSSLADLPELGTRPTTIMLGNAGLAYYLFADSTARRTAAARLDTVRFIPQSKPLSMRNEATLIQNDNALVILLSRNEHQRERVADAITAGAPQP
jgi:hypothetical protein